MIDCEGIPAKFMGPTWGPPGSCRPQMGPMLASWTLLSGMLSNDLVLDCDICSGLEPFIVEPFIHVYMYVDSVSMWVFTYHHTDDLLKDCRNSIANTLELLCSPLQCVNFVEPTITCPTLHSHTHTLWHLCSPLQCVNFVEPTITCPTLHSHTHTRFDICVLHCSVWILWSQPLHAPHCTHTRYDICALHCSVWISLMRPPHAPHCAHTHTLWHLCSPLQRGYPGANLHMPHTARTHTHTHAMTPVFSICSVWISLTRPPHAPHCTHTHAMTSVFSIAVWISWSQPPHAPHCAHICVLHWSVWISWSQPPHAPHCTHTRYDICVLHCSVWISLTRPPHALHCTHSMKSV